MNGFKNAVSNAIYQDRKLLINTLVDDLTKTNPKERGDTCYDGHLFIRLHLTKILIYIKLLCHSPYISAV